MEKVAKVFKNINQQKRIYSNFGNKTYPLSNLHLTSTQNYPVAEPLPIPANVDPAETTKFSPQRARDITHNHIISHQANSLNSRSMDITLDSSNNDPHIGSYDCHGAVNLNCTMQSNVPQPFGGLNKFTHLNMPGGQWGQESKFMSQNLQSSHYTTLRSEARSAWSRYDENATTEKGIRLRIGKLTNNLHVQCLILNNLPYCCSHTYSYNKQITRNFSSINDKEKTPDVEQKKPEQLSRKEQLKKAFKEYGSTVIIFHITISLISLQIFYLLVSRGIDVMPIVESLGLGSTALSTKIATGASTFVVAYAIHKVFAPVRISITLGATPFIVRYLRQKGFLKKKIN